MSRTKKILGGSILAIILVLGSALLVSPAAITQLAGIALAITSTNWTPLQDPSLGDGLSRGVLVPYLFNGST